MQFNPDKNKQAIQVIFSQKRDKPAHPLLYINRSEVVLRHEQKHFGMILDSELSFYSHVKEKIVNARKAIGVIRFMSRYVTREVLDQMYKLYLRPHLDMVLDFTKKFEATPYAAALAVSGAWRGTNRDKLYEELGWEYLYHRRWYRRLIHFYKLKKSRSPPYLYNLIPPEREVHYNLRIPRDFEPNISRTKRFSNTYFQNSINEWNSLDVSTRKCGTVSQFKTKLINLVRPPKKSTFKIHDINCIKLLTRLRVGFSDLRFRHNFNCASPLCLCQTGIEDNEHYSLHCPRFAHQHKIMLDLVCRITNINIMRQSSKELCNLLRYGDSNSMS